MSDKWVNVGGAYIRPEYAIAISPVQYDEYEGKWRFIIYFKPFTEKSFSATYMSISEDTQEAVTEKHKEVVEVLLKDE